MNRTVVLALVSAAVAGSVLTWYSARQEREYRRLIAVGDASLARDQTFVAVEAFSGAVALQPDSMLAYLKRGDTYRRRGDLAAALRDIRQAVTLDPTSTRALELLGDVNVAMTRYERAADNYRRFIALDDRSPRVLYKLALAHYRNGQSAQAIEALRQAVTLDERFSEAHHLLGLCLRERARKDEAVRALRRAIDLNPAFVAARGDLANLYCELGRNRDCIEQLEALAAIEPSRAERLVMVGLTYARLGRTDAAIATLGRAAERYSEEPTVHAAIGRVWLEAAEQRVDRAALRKALEALRPAATRANASSETLALYGRALFLAGDTPAAANVLQQATETAPREPVAFLWLAAAAERRGDAEAAHEALADYTSLVEGNDPIRLAARVGDSLRLQQRLRFIGAAALSRDPRRPSGRLPES
jgi:tetratricopeptide (TPR) repeat protein